jgi:hypothetical protein
MFFNRSEVISFLTFMRKITTTIYFSYVYLDFSFYCIFTKVYTTFIVWHCFHIQKETE